MTAITQRGATLRDLAEAADKLMPMDCFEEPELYNADLYPVAAKQLYDLAHTAVATAFRSKRSISPENRTVKKRRLNINGQINLRLKTILAESSSTKLRAEQLLDVVQALKQNSDRVALETVGKVSRAFASAVIGAVEKNLIPKEPYYSDLIWLSGISAKLKGWNSLFLSQESGRRSGSFLLEFLLKLPPISKDNVVDQIQSIEREIKRTVLGSLPSKTLQKLNDLYSERIRIAIVWKLLPESSLGKLTPIWDLLVKTAPMC